MEVIWRYMYIHQKGKSEKLKAELKNANGQIKLVRRDLKLMKRKNKELRRALVDATEGYVTEFCENCGMQQSFFWDRETMGSVAYCPSCGNVMRLCSYCEGECDYNAFTHTCKGKVVYEEGIG